MWNGRSVTLVTYPFGKNALLRPSQRFGKEHFHIFTWNAQHCTLDKTTGRVLLSGEGDESLRRFGSLVPLRVTPGSVPRSVGRTLHGLEAVKWSIENWIASRKVGTFELSQPIPASKLKKFYAVEFATHDGHGPEPDWRPLSVIVWKGQSRELIDLNKLTINGPRTLRR